MPSGDGDIIVVSTYSDQEGRVIANYSGRRIRQYRPNFGAACYAISERHTALEKLSREFLNAIGYRGFSMLEFARGRQDGCNYFLELDTRMTW
jgi:predicted ATP-grasp superfamily ATP-dependent carboligase